MENQLFLQNMFSLHARFFSLSISLSSLLRNGVRATLLSLQPAYVGHTPEARLVSHWGLVHKA